MKTKSPNPRTLRARPRLEILEDRTAPAVNILFDGANLTITGDPGTTLTITQNPADVTVMDDFGNYGPYAVTGNITASLTNAIAARTITYDLGANTTGGSVAISTGNVLGGNTVALTGAGTIGGNFSVTGGNGSESFDLQEATIRGSVILNLRGADDTVNVGSVNPATIDGNLTGTGVNSFELFDNSIVGGHVTLNTTGEIASATTYFFDGSAGNQSSVGGNVFVSTGVVTGAGTFVFQGRIAGNLVAGLNTAPTSNTFTIDSSADVLGSVTIRGGNSSDNVTLAAGSDVLGNIAMIGGIGSDTLTLNGNVLGSSIIFSGGNGSDTLQVGATATMGSARLFGYLGNGVDTYRADVAATLFSAYIDYGAGADIFDPTDMGVTGLPYRYRITHRNK